MDRLRFDDLIEIAAIALEVPSELLEETVCVFRAQAVLAAPFIRVFGADVYEDPVERAVICALLMIRWQPFLRRQHGSRRMVPARNARAESLHLAAP